jgi:glycosyltransferase involved in cell wall biosynthesis
VRVVVSDHVTLSRQYCQSPWTMALLKLSTRRFYPLADGRICVSAGSAADLSRIARLEPEQITVVYNPIPGPKKPLVTSPEAELSWSGARARILSVGNLKTQKNHALLIRAIALLDRKYAARLVIMGEGPLRSQLANLAAELGIAESIAMPGFTDDLWPFYASAAVFVLSSDYEGFGNVLVEALHAGLPVVSTDCADGPAEILAQGEFGMLVPCGDAAALASAIERAFENPVDKARLAARAREFDPDAAVERYLDLLLGGATGVGIAE